VPVARLTEDRRLFERYRATGDASVRDVLVARFLPLAAGLARRYAHAGEPLDDLVQVASVGLLKAIERFDPSRGTAFSTFAVPTIAGELKRHFRDTGWAVRVPRRVQELALEVGRAGGELERELGREATPAEIAERIGASTEAVIEACRAPRAHRRLSLDHALAQDRPAAALVEQLGEPDDEYGRVEDVLTVEHLMATLGQREREVVRMRYYEELSQVEIGRRMGFSQAHASRLLSRAIARMGRVADSPGCPYPA
jgi:RNA polymerase sigma-B factor